ncbi:prepilin-type N-terminal cleavage/methylation domain-containing protein [Deinococcus psychrotolerans]|uniref:Prepilin-type N-terminal cleavage/methylation domain-containing protein n=1 Tax=Deinococcus psychrotolerans TaxID=2489213 RepID=A0A3G8YDN3_9DEIO|nr:prepilin-type N-terminal cleavage/methylation domain-containing protein [Deinococcus psychrotolerans]AZI42337.1 prepilin-type N-terminal cleavage/methylation domain-containing protein [Deinococcus psychrotolerans]
MRRDHLSQGFTIIEILVAIVLLGIVIIITAQPLINSLRLSATSENTLSGTQEAQDVLERARALVVADYGTPQADLNNMVKPSTSTILCQDVAPDLTISATCADTTGDTPFLRRLTVTTTVVSQAPVVLSLDVRP